MTVKYKDFMIDIETLGNTSNAAVVQIGCVGFDMETGKTSVPFKISVTPHSKSSMDFSTVQWWMGQSDAARKSVFEGHFFDTDEALTALSEFIKDNTDEVTKVWSKPSTFDIVILENLYRNCGMQPPWKHWNTRCLRTLLDVTSFPRSDEVTPTIAHDAAYDALAQAQTAIIAITKPIELDNGDT